MNHMQIRNTSDNTNKIGMKNVNKFFLLFILGYLLFVVRLSIILHHTITNTKPTCTFHLGESPVFVVFHWEEKRNIRDDLDKLVCTVTFQ